MVHHPIVVRYVYIARELQAGPIVIIRNQGDHDQNHEGYDYADKKVYEDGQESDVFPFSYVDDFYPVALPRDGGISLGKTGGPDIKHQRQNREYNQYRAVSRGQAGAVLDGHGIIDLGHEDIDSAGATLEDRRLEGTQSS